MAEQDAGFVDRARAEELAGMAATMHLASQMIAVAARQLELANVRTVMLEGELARSRTAGNGGTGD